MKYLLLFFVLVGCCDKKEETFNYDEYYFTCSSEEKIYDIQKTSDDYVFEILVLDYAGYTKSYLISKPYLKKQFNTNCSKYDNYKVLFLIDKLTNRLNKIEEKLKIK